MLGLRSNLQNNSEHGIRICDRILLPGPAANKGLMQDFFRANQVLPYKQSASLSAIIMAGIYLQVNQF